MTELREKALRLVEEMPEENLLVLMQIIQEKNLSQKKGKGKINLAEVVEKHSEAAGNLFGSVEKIYNYVKGLRSEWDSRGL